MDTTLNLNVKAPPPEYASEETRRLWDEMRVIQQRLETMRQGGGQEATGERATDEGRLSDLLDRVHAALARDRGTFTGPTRPSLPLAERQADLGRRLDANRVRQEAVARPAEQADLDDDELARSGLSVREALAREDLRRQAELNRLLEEEKQLHQEIADLESEARRERETAWRERQQAGDMPRASDLAEKVTPSGPEKPAVQAGERGEVYGDTLRRDWETRTRARRRGALDAARGLTRRTGEESRKLQGDARRRAKAEKDADREADRLNARWKAEETRRAKAEWAARQKAQREAGRASSEAASQTKKEAEKAQREEERKRKEREANDPYRHVLERQKAEDRRRQWAKDVQAAKSDLARQGVVDEELDVGPTRASELANHPLGGLAQQAMGGQGIAGALTGAAAGVLGPAAVVAAVVAAFEKLKNGMMGLGDAVASTSKRLGALDTTLLRSGTVGVAQGILESDAVNNNTLGLGGLASRLLNTPFAFAEGLSGTARQLGPYSGPLATQLGLARARSTIGDIRRSQYLGSDLAGFVESGSKLEQTALDALARLLKPFIPKLTKLMDDVEPLVDYIPRFVERYEENVLILAAILKAVAAGPAGWGTLAAELSSIHDLVVKFDRDANRPKTNSLFLDEMKGIVEGF